MKGNSQRSGNWALGLDQGNFLI